MGVVLSNHNDVVQSWLRSYEKDAVRDLDDWLSRYRRDFAPDRWGRIALSESIVRKSVKPVRRRLPVSVREFEYVGHGGVTNPNKCGRFLSFGGCLLHDRIWCYKVLNSCDSPKCSCCYRAWASRLARMIEPRLASASTVLGEVEHIIISLPKVDHDLSYEEMRDKCVRLLKKVTVHSGYALLHSKSFGKYRPHFHVLGWIGAEGGAERCRNCTGRIEKRCYSCDGIWGRIYRADAKSGYIIKVLDKRKTVGGTVFYEAEHCTIDYSKRRFRVGCWFGRAGYSNFWRLGVKVEKAKALCPVCKSETGLLEYSGSKDFVLDYLNNPSFRRSSREALTENGEMVWRVRSEPLGGGRRRWRLVKFDAG